MNIVLAPAEILTTPTIAVDPTSAEALEVAGDLMEVLAKVDHAAAVSAPQIGSGIAMFAYRDRDHNPTILSNPVIIDRRGRQLGMEGCLSYPDMVFQVLRAQTITVTGQDIIGDPVRERFTGWHAHMVQHEVDHLDGILVTSRTKRAVNRDMANGRTS